MLSELLSEFFFIGDGKSRNGSYQYSLPYLAAGTLLVEWLCAFEHVIGDNTLPRKSMKATVH